MYLRILLLLSCFCLSTSTLPANWTAPHQLATDQGESLNFFYPIDLAYNGHGDAIAIWTLNDGTNQLIFSGILPNNSSTWSAPVRVSPLGEDAFNPSLAVNANGYAVVVWNTFTLPATAAVKAAVLNTVTNPAGPWAQTANLSNPSNTSVLPQVTIDSSGNAVAAWITFTSEEETFIEGALLPFPLLAWTPTTPLTSPSSNADSVVLKTDAVGATLAIWVEFTTTSTSVIKSASLPKLTTTWLNTTAISASDGTAFGPDLALDINGNGVAVWTDYKGNDRNGFFIIESASYTKASTSWGAVTQVSLDNEDSFTPKVKIGTDLKAIAVWCGGPNLDTGVIEAAYLNSNASAWVQYPYLTTADHDSSLPVIDIDPSNNAIVVWVEELKPSKGCRAASQTGTLFTIQSAILRAGTSAWLRTPQISSNADSDAYFPLVALDGNTNAVALWKAYTDTSDKTLASQRLHLFGPLPVTNFQGKVKKNKFATQTDLIHVLSWTPVTDSLRVGFRIYQNNIALGSVLPATATTTSLHARNPHQKYLYTIVSVYADGSESAFVPPITL